MGLLNVGNFHSNPMIAVAIASKNSGVSLSNHLPAIAETVTS